MSKTARTPGQSGTGAAAGTHPGPDESHHGHKAFGWTYWMLNTIEAFERLAYFGIRYVVPIYIMQATEPGGLHLTAVHKGWIYMWWAVFQSWLPMFTGGIADRYGYKRVLAMAITANCIGYLMMASWHNYYGFFAGILVLATGTAFFKPALQGSIAQNLTKENSSMGWGIFYWVVNVGAVLAPLLATVILGQPHSQEGWRNLFLASAAYTAMNLLLLLTFRDVPSGADKSQSVVQVFGATVENIWPYWFRGGRFEVSRAVPGLLIALFGLLLFIVPPLENIDALERYEDLAWLQWTLGGVMIVAGLVLLTWLKGGEFTWQLRLPAFLLIMSCFWMMMYQVWDLHPNFIEDWIDSSAVAQHVPFDSWWEYGDVGLKRVPQQILITLNAFLIVVLVVPISWLVRKMRTLSAMLIGMSVATAGILVSGLTHFGWILLLGIVFFSLGEMLTGPKKNQYLGLIAPPGKKGLYLGYVNIPVGVGVGLGSMIAGLVYDNYGEKASLALKHLGHNTELVARAAEGVDWSDSLHLIPGLIGLDRDQAFETVAQRMETDDAAAAAALRDAFRYDQGQVINLSLQYLALEEKHRQDVAQDLSRILTDKKQPPELQAIGRRLEAGAEAVDASVVARCVHLLPKALDHGRVEVFDIVREDANEARSEDEGRLSDSDTIDMLWERFGDEPATLDNLALEYLAQHTDLVHDAVAQIEFGHPVEEMEERIGIGRTKSFIALSIALGADEEAVDAALREMDMASDDLGDRAFVYLIEQPHRRFKAVARKDWTRDEELLRALIRDDPAALEVVLEGIDRQSWSERLWSSIKGMFTSAEDEGVVTEEGVNYSKLAPKQGLIQEALAAKHWTDNPEEAARLLRLNPYEARALVGAELNKAPLKTTRLLWEAYHPQYKVWVPFASIGVLATIALGIFGQMAKRWADMNA